MVKNLTDKCEYIRPYSKATTKPYRCISNSPCKDQERLSDGKTYCLKSLGQ